MRGLPVGEINSIFNKKKYVASSVHPSIGAKISPAVLLGSFLLAPEQLKTGFCDSLQGAVF